MTAPTRRTVLAGMAGAALTAPAVAALPAAAGANPDATLIDLGKQWLEVEEALSKNSDEFDRRQDTLPAWAKPGPNERGRREIVRWPKIDYRKAPFSFLPKPFGEWELGPRPSLAELRRFNDGKVSRGLIPNRAQTRAEGRVRVRAWIVRVREQRALEEAAGLTAVEAEGEVLLKRSYRLEDAIAATPAHTAEGLAVKIKVCGSIEPHDVAQEGGAS